MPRSGKTQGKWLVFSKRSNRLLVPNLWTLKNSDWPGSTERTAAIPNRLASLSIRTIGNREADSMGIRIRDEGKVRPVLDRFRPNLWCQQIGHVWPPRSQPEAIEILSIADWPPDLIHQWLAGHYEDIPGETLPLHWVATVGEENFPLFTPMLASGSRNSTRQFTSDGTPARISYRGVPLCEQAIMSVRRYGGQAPRFSVYSKHTRE